ncbi:TIGR03767 family metallophosphoesterase [Streptomyces sp. AK02-01A]|uniref:TIGR03767 family metallophosphoesterase n=1 Tax=Streptomyces sp. AK02-01A TaxID=3028648 RepID=UPI0029A510A7|nr:TIGR03767 family metallophosphoesterase [Streptomyces sp. AK02-01A]MDX3852445.1 TIGR03767 family metallophosphoesterase [Streptomyces sp. AK02-01A]
MKRIRSAVTAVDRRSFLTATGAVGISAGIGLALGAGGGSGEAVAAPGATIAPAVPRPRTPAQPTRTVPARTTLESVAAPRDTSVAFRRLDDGPGWRRLVREQLATPRAGRDSRRTVLSSFVQLTDLHLVDVQHPVRTEYLRSQQLSGWRPQEALTVPGAVALIEQINALTAGPATGAPLSFAVTTGDNTDNNSRSELDWFLAVMSGGRISPNTGDSRLYEGVQNSDERLFWHPEDALRDTDKHLGYPRIDGFLAAAISSVNSPGLRIPWYSTVGNHDSLASGAIADRSGFLAEFAVGARKLYGVPDADAKALVKILSKGSNPAGGELVDLLRHSTRRMRSITPDPSRAPFGPREYVTAHLDPARAGAGPVGHGYTAANLDSDTLYYTFPMGKNITGISLDTTDRAGHFTGSLDTTQLNWLKRKLKELRDGYVVVFSHHNSWTMTNTHPDPAHPGQARHNGDEVVALLKRNRNVLAWVNGHSHRNSILPHGTFWEISTASHIDFPQLARVIEITDNGDGTLSLFTTLIESAAPHRTDFEDLSQTGLAALYRELSHNAPGSTTAPAGVSTDRNTELLLSR